MTNKNYNKSLLLILALLIGLSVSARTFVHPGISHKLSDLDRMKYMVQAGAEPWKTSFANLQANSYASYNYKVQWSKDSTTIHTIYSGSYEKIKYDGLAAYYNALEWYITGDTRYAAKCVEIFKAWSNIKSIVTGGTDCLDAGRVIWKALEGAEIIKNTYSGWAQTDIDAFKAMLVYPGYSSTTVPTADIDANNVSFYWLMYNGDYGRHGNQGLFGFRGIMAMGIFMDNELMYDRALRYLRGQTHRADDLAYVSGQPIVSSTKNPYPTSNSYFDDFTPISPYLRTTVSDYGYNEVIGNYIWSNGQSQESSRDQGHGLLGLSIINTMCEMAWNQGDDLYNILDFRPLLGLEFYNRYNVSYHYSFTDQISSWEPTVASGEFIQKKDRSGRWLSRRINPFTANDTVSLTRGTFVTTGNGPINEMVLAHYKSRMNLDKSRYKWTARCDSISQKVFGYEKQGFQVDHPGFGGLTFHRADSCPGDPVTFVNKLPVFGMKVVPCKIEAEDYDYFTSNGQGHSFYDLSGTKIANDYRSDSIVTLKTCSAGGYKVSDIAAGEWLSYTVEFTESAPYYFALNYTTPTTGAKYKININGVDKTSEINLPVTGNDVWANSTAQSISLTPGVKSVRIIFSGVSNVLELNSINIVKTLTTIENTINENQTINAFKNTDNQIIVNCKEITGQEGIITVHNMLGQKLIEAHTTGTSTVLSKLLFSGLYIVTVNANGNQYTKKAVIN